jgi:hypothetical protein
MHAVDILLLSTRRCGGEDRAPPDLTWVAVSDAGEAAFRNKDAAKS